MRQLDNISKLIRQENYLIVKYENLVTSPETTVRHICSMIGEEYETSMLDIDTHNSSSTQATDGIFSSSVDRWKTELTPEEIVISQRICDDELGRLDYPIRTISSSILKRVIIYLSTPYSLIRALHANRNSRGPLIPYLVKRIGALVAGK